MPLDEISSFSNNNKRYLLQHWHVIATLIVYPSSQSAVITGVGVKSTVAHVSLRTSLLLTLPRSLLIIFYKTNNPIKMFWREPVFITHTKTHPLNVYNKIFIFNLLFKMLSGRNKNKSSNLVSTLLVASEALRRSAGCLIRWQECGSARAHRRLS